MSNLPAKSTGLPAKASGGKLPAIATKPSGRLRPFDRYAENAQRILEFYVHFDSLLSKIKSCSDLEHVERMLQICDERYREMVAQCERDRQSFEPANAYDEDGYIKEEMVSMHIATLLASYPNSNASDPEAYLVMMVEEVMAVYPKLTVLDSACRQVRRTSKFPPVTSEVLAAIKEQEDIWDNRWNAMESLEITAEELREALPVERERRAEAKRKEEERRAIATEQQRVNDELRAKPLGVGDRVKFWNQRFNDYGTIIETVDNWMHEKPGFNVIFDDTAEVYFCETSKLDRVFPTDHNFAIWESKRAAVAQKIAERKEAARVLTEQAAEIERRRLLPLNIGDRVFNTKGKHFGKIVGMSEHPDRCRDVENDSGYIYKAFRENLELRDQNDGRPSPGFDPDHPVDRRHDDEPDQILGMFPR
jgi:hypothetical protein